MIEDEIYRASSQYRYWSFTREALASLRQSTNETAAERVQAAFSRIRHAKEGEDGDGRQGTPVDADVEPHQLVREIETLTVEEELKVIRWGCVKIIEIGKVMNPPIPMEIRATAIQFLRRFYLTNSPMTYHPKQILTCALFLATKADHWHIPLSTFVDKIPSTEEKDVRAPEFLLMQGLRFTLDVRHPMRGLEGGIGEMLRLLEDKKLLLDGADAKARIGKVADRASRLLRGAAQMTDLYFLYTPSQIWFAALMAVDSALALKFLSLKMARLGPGAEELGAKLEIRINSCSEMLSAFKAEDEVGEAEQREMEREMKQIRRKLHRCQNPENIDLVAVTKQKAAEKRDGIGSDRDKVVKKRRLERERLEQDAAVFGPSLRSPAV